MHKSRNFSNCTFVVILYDLYNNKCMEIGFVIHLIKSHPKQQKEMSFGFVADKLFSISLKKREVYWKPRSDVSHLTVFSFSPFSFCCCFSSCI